MVWKYLEQNVLFQFYLGRQLGPVIRGLGLHANAPGSNPVQACGLDLFPSCLGFNSTTFVNSQLVASCQLGFLIMFLLSFNCFFLIIKSEVPVNYSLIAKCTSTISQYKKIP